MRVFCTIAHYPPYLKPRTSQCQGLKQFEWCVPAVEGQYVPYPAVPILSRALNAYTCYRQLYEAVRIRSRPDVILNYWLYPEGCAAVMLGRKIGVPVIVGAIGSDLCARRGTITRHLTRWTLQNAEGVMTAESRPRPDRPTTDRRVKKRMRNNFERLRRITVQVARSGRPRGALGIQSCARNRSFCGLFSTPQRCFRSHRGGATYFLRAFRHRSVFDRRWHRHRGGAESRLQWTGRPRIHVLGSRTAGEVALWMSAADVFCLPSHREGCPNALLEAMNCGCRVVATAVGGTPELVDSEHGTLVPPGDVRRLGEALLEALEMPRARCEANGPTRRTWDDVAGETFDICRRTVSSYEWRHCYARAAARRAGAGRA